MKSKILIHVCCAPCATATLEQVMSDFPLSDILLYYYNPNIHPFLEEDKRYVELKQYIVKRYGTEIDLLKGEYDHDAWISMVEPLSLSGEGGLRCRICYYIRLLSSFKIAEKEKCSHVTTTLSISPHKNFEWLNETGALLSEKFCINWFLEKWDYRKSVALSKEYELYRQNYCGCSFSKDERKTT